MKTPVIFMIFKRPETTCKVFARIRAAQPEKLLIIADGPRKEKAGEAERCAEARRIAENIDWPCELIKNYADSNMGCRDRISSGLDWAFSLVDEAIILEDDCLPDDSFFRYASEMLEKYRYNEKLMMVAGSNYLGGEAVPEDSYYFSAYAHIWGWATWKRAWKRYDVEMKRWPELREKAFMRGFFKDWYMLHYFTRTFDRIYRKEIDTWDVQWTFACFVHGGLSIVPKNNLICNIGYGESSGTHCSNVSGSAFMKTEPLDFPLKYPEKIIVNKRFDEIEKRRHFNKTFLGKIRCLLSKIRLSITGRNKL